MTIGTRPTLATVAEALGVSRMTVSNAFNRPDQLSPELREKVLAKAQELGYGGPNPIARTLSKGKTGSIGVVIDAPLTLAFSDPAAVAMLHGVATICEERGLGLSLVPRIPGRDAALVQSALVDGFIVYCIGDEDPRLEAIIERRLPYALIDNAPGKADLQVNIDDRKAARETAEHLLRLGHTKFGVAIGEDDVPEGHHVARERLAGWREALAAAGIAWDSVAIAAGPGFDRETGRIAGAQLLDRAARPTAVVCFSDVQALGVIDAAHARGIDVPLQLSVAGFDDTPDAQRAALTTVRQPHTQKGCEALRLLLDETKRSVLLPTELVPRSTTAPSP
jgi:DNA-binding LacI/PurR family transcriptional regulator